LLLQNILTAGQGYGGAKYGSVVVRVGTSKMCRRDGSDGRDDGGRLICYLYVFTVTGRAFSSTISMAQPHLHIHRTIYQCLLILYRFSESPKYWQGSASPPRRGKIWG
jgi:hypothetical protein